MIMKRHISAPRARDQCKTSICSISSAVLQPLDATGPSQGGMVAPLVVGTTIVKAVVEAVDNNNDRKVPMIPSSGSVSCGQGSNRF